MQEYSRQIHETYAMRRQKTRRLISRAIAAFDRTIDQGDPKPQFFTGIEVPQQITNIIAEQGRNPLDIIEETLHLGLMISGHRIHQGLPDGTSALLKLADVNPAVPQDLSRPKREDVQFDARTEARLRQFSHETHFQDWFLRSLAARMRLNDMRLLHLAEDGTQALDTGLLKRLIADRTLPPIFLKPSPLPESQHVQSDIPRGMVRVFLPS